MFQPVEQARIRPTAQVRGLPALAGPTLSCRERFLWKLTPKGRVALAYHGKNAGETQSLLQLSGQAKEHEQSFVRA
jgi:hypothetical protein